MDIRVDEDVRMMIESEGRDYRVCTACTGPALVPVEVKKPKDTDIRIPVGGNTLYISRIQARYIDRVTMDMLYDREDIDSCPAFYSYVRRRRTVISHQSGGAVMKVLLLNGSPHSKGCTNRALTEIRDQLARDGVEADIVHVKSDAPGCRACRYCKKNGRCVIDDQVNQVAETLDGYDAVVLGAPVYYAGPAGQTCAFADRLFYSAGYKIRGKPGAAVVSCRRAGSTASFDRLNKYFSITEMPIVSSQYWNEVHGNTPEEVEKDEEGLQTMRTLANNLAWLLGCIEAGRRAGIGMPEREPWTPTNFIR